MIVALRMLIVAGGQEAEKLGPVAVEAVLEVVEEEDVGQQ